MNTTTLKLAVRKAGMTIAKHSPEILTAVGIITSVTATVYSGVATANHLEDILDTHRNEIYRMREINLDEKELNQRKTRIYLYTVSRIVKLYAPVAVMQAISIACSFGGHKILKDRYVATAAAYSAVSEAYNAYRQRVIEDGGEELDAKYRFGAVDHEEEIKEGKKIAKQTITEMDISKKASPYSRCFDETNENWHGSADLNLLFLRNIQNWANDMLHIRGHVFLNEVYEMLGFEHTQEGAVVGWILSNEEDAENFIDFGIYNLLDPTKRMFVNGQEAAVWLDFNVHGLIWNKI